MDLVRYKYYIIYWLINLWNRIITPIRNFQNQHDSFNFNIAPGFQFATVSKHESIKKLNTLILQNHNQILKEVQNLLNTGYTGLPMNEIDPIQGNVFKNASGWRPIWIKFLDKIDP